MYVGLHGENHEDAARMLASIAVVLMDQGKSAEALAVQEKVLDINRHTLGSDSDDVAMSLFNLGNAYCDQGMLEEGLARF
eukprot:CAMPEP_0169451098 /NCGR_PEP_ID=MMETSP1042-20121227/13513_1 /TAXON_ID=464988 /ORGANISM="Hemiselmis andersenii, Strain CCMP1180" /LENGTH=79 /DNA_ID=CAMNT_0009562981 /DNA_START=15 /DNA_END=251 /DNA_ORIENTATION=+